MDLLKKWRIRALLVTAFFLLILALAFLNRGGKVEEAQPAYQAPEKAEATLPVAPPAGGEVNYTTRDPLTGRGAERLHPLLAVIVDNLGPARPQSGLERAGVVYEVEVEGLITRFLALYRSDPPERVGPVRSARPYLVDLAREWGAWLVHAGGSDDAYAALAASPLPHLDSMRGGSWFSVDKTRRAPHNTYLDPLAALAGRKEEGREPTWRAGQPAGGGKEVFEISFAFAPGYVVSYRWSPEKRAYLRSINGEPHRDRLSGRQLEVTNLILQFAPHRELGDKLQHIKVELVGEGRAEYLIGGRHLVGKWQKKDASSPTLFLDGEGRAVTVAPGNTWIEILRTGREVHGR